MISNNQKHELFILLLKSRRNNVLFTTCINCATLLPPDRGEISRSADGVLAASIDLRYYGNQRSPQAGHQHQETDAA